MAKMNSKVYERFKEGMKKYQKLFTDAASYDINESDTVSIIRDFFCEVLGYDKYLEITSEYAIRGTFCDLAIKIGGKVQFLIEVKAIGLTLKDNHIRQAQGYAANEGVDWVILTNGRLWNIYKLSFQKPVQSELIFTLDLVNANLKDERMYEMLFVLSKEGISKSAIEDYHAQFEALNRYSIGAMILSEPMINSLKRELRKCHKGMKVEEGRLRQIITEEIFKREIVESDKLKSEVSRCNRKMSADKRQKAASDSVHDKNTTTGNDADNTPVLQMTTDNE